MILKAMYIAVIATVGSRLEARDWNYRVIPLIKCYDIILCL